MTDFNDALLDIIVRQRAEMAEHRRNEETPLFGLRAQPDILQELELQLWRPTAVEGADPGEAGATLPLKTVLVLRRAVDEIKSLRSELALKQGYKASYETTLAVTNSLREEIAGLRAGVPLEREAPVDVRVNDLNEGWKTFYDEEKRRFSETANGLKVELAEVRQALGMLTTLAPNMEIDVDDPMGMAQQIIDVCRADHTGYIAASTALSSALVDIDRLRSNQRASGNQIEEIQNRLTTLLEEVFRKDGEVRWHLGDEKAVEVAGDTVRGMYRLLEDVGGVLADVAATPSLERVDYLRAEIKGFTKEERWYWEKPGLDAPKGIGE